jgi:hypothetical protein
VAARRVVEGGHVHVHLPFVGEIGLPSTEEAVYVGGLATLAALGLLEWPIAILLGIGHHLAMSGHDKGIRAFGEALDEA